MLKKSYGQHFLHDKNIIAKIISSVRPTADEMIVEVGPGAGALTEGLVDLVSSGGLTLVESDRDLIPSLQSRFPLATIVQADAAQTDYDEITKGRPWIFVSNLPYNAGNAILEKVFTSKHPPRELTVMVQKEVGERMMAKPGDMSVLSVATQLYADVTRLFIVKPGAFIPPPKVDSIMLRMVMKGVGSRQLGVGGEDDREAIIALTKIAFAHRRKQLRQTLAQSNVADLVAIDSALETLGYPKTVRPQDIDTENWTKLFNILKR